MSPEARRRTYVDAGVLIATIRGDAEAAQAAMQVLDDPERALIVSDALWLEVLPKPIYEGRDQERQAHEAVFQGAHERVRWDVAVLRQAEHVASRYGLAAMDAIHVACAMAANADEIVTTEKDIKPIFRVSEIRVISLREAQR